MSHGSPSGRLCLRCFGVRQEQVDERARIKRAKNPVVHLRAISVASRDLQKRASILGPDADTALRLGAATLNAEAQRVTQELAAAAEDPTSPFHRDALEMLANRILPLPALGKAAVRLARSGALDPSTDGKRASEGPLFVVTVGLTHGLERK